MPVTLTCEKCGREFEVSPYYAKRGQRFCSLACAGMSARTPAQSVKCAQCGALVKRSANKIKRNAHHFCSWACYAKWRNGRMVGEDNATWKGGRKRKDGLRISNALLRQIKERDGNRCLECGATEVLCVHHVVKPKDGGTNELSNLLTLCQSCHQSLHRRQG